MLLQSDRHTKADIAIWMEREAADHVHGETLDRKIAAAKEAVRQFTRGACYVAVSGGKDSSVLWALVQQVAPMIPFRFLATEPLVDPYCRDVLRNLQIAFPVADYKEHMNHCSIDRDGVHATGTMESGIRDMQQETGTKRVLLGVRAMESSIRAVSIDSLGVTTATSCRPLAYWSDADVFGYAARFNVPLHPTYAMTGGGRWKREKLRVSFLTLKHGRGMGRGEWEREYYCDVLNRIEAMACSQK